MGKGKVDFGDLLKDEFSVILLQGKNTFGDMVYCYVKVNLPNVEKLQAALTGGKNFNPSDFGEVIAAGKGTPPDSIRAEIASTYSMMEQPRIMNPGALPPTEKKAWDEY